MCLVTDRRRLGHALGRPASEWCTLLLEQIRGAVQGGVDLVQIREPDLEAGVLAELVTRAVRITGGSPSRVIVNDRVDVALAAGAAGVHLRENSPLPAQVRRLVPAGFVVGRSVHGTESASLDPSADYLIAGTVFPTASKPVATLLGLDGFEAVVRMAGSTPVLGIGGVTEARLADLGRVGASGFAAIGAFIPPTGSGRLAAQVQETAKNLRFAFDTGSTVS